MLQLSRGSMSKGFNQAGLILEMGVKIFRTDAKLARSGEKILDAERR